MRSAIAGPVGSALLGCALPVAGALLLLACRRTEPSAATRSAKMPARSVQGNHRVEADCAAGPASLSLKSGLRAEVCTTATAGSALLAIAERRLAAAEVSAVFVPLGPSFVLSAQDREVGVDWLAESYRIRDGFRPVLALRSDRLRLLDASYTEARFRARVPPRAGSLMQFGLVPLTDDGGVSASDASAWRSEAP